MTTKRIQDKGGGIITTSLLAGGLWLASAALPLGAATIDVTTFADEIDANGQCSLREAIVNTNDNAQTYADCLAGEAGTIAMDVINLPAGTYTLTITGVDERCENITYYPAGTPCTGSGTEADPYKPVITVDASMGDLDIIDDLTITGAGADLTLIQWGAAAAGDDDPLTGDRIFHVQTDGANIGSVVIQDLSVTNGEVGLIPTSVAEGAGDLVIPDDVNAYDIEVVDTTAGSVDIWQFRRMGGAIALGAGYAVVHYEQTIHGPGGGGGDADMGPFPGGKTGEEEGFAIGNVTLNRVVLFSNWSGADGGGLYSAVPGTLNQAAISGNFSGANGGGIYNDAGLSISGSLIGKVFDPDTALQYPELTTPNVGENGGGLFDTGSHTTTIVGSAINGNEAIGGGGIAARALITVNIDNSTISGNVGTDVGGGITTNGTVNLRNATVAYNVAATDAPGGGGGLNSFGSGTYNFNNTVLAYNEVSGRADPVSNCGCSGGSALCPDGVMNSGFYNIEYGDTCDLQAFIGTDFPNTDPMLVALADNGGLTETHALPSNSPAVDQGWDILCTVLAQAPWGAFDQRGVGFSRTRDGNGDSVSVCDMGAFEYAPATVTPTPPSGGGSSGGLCSYDPNGRFDPVLPLLVMLSLICLAWRRRVATQ